MSGEFGAPSKETRLLSPPCAVQNCQRGAALVIYNRVLDECLPDEAPVAVMYSCDRHWRFVAWYCHAVDEDIQYLGPF
jgi:hypothetical protein